MLLDFLARAHLLITLMAQPPAIEQRIRNVEVAERRGAVYAIDVLASPKVTTTIRFPEGFDASDVLCGGACIDAGSVDGPRQTAAANWVIEKRPLQHSIHVWPARLPGPGNPTSAYTTNVYVATDDGKAYNLTLKLLDLSADQRAADAVVDITHPGAPEGAARIASLQAKCRQEAREELFAEARGILFAGLDGRVSCRNVHWNVPHRNGALVMRVTQLCRSSADKPLLWVHFALENRGSAPLRIDSIRLEPISSSFGGQSEDAAHLSESIIAGKSRVSGVAVRNFSTAEHGLRGWRLEAIPEPNEMAGTIAIDNINF